MNQRTVGLIVVGVLSVAGAILLGEYLGSRGHLSFLWPSVVRPGRGGAREPAEGYSESQAAADDDDDDN